jgi:trigger factor
VTIAVKDLKIESTDIQPCVKKIKIEIPEKLVSKEYEKALNKVRKGASVQGFRKGKAPREIMEKLYSDSILWDVGQKMISEGYEKALSDQKLKVFGDPSFDEVTVEPGKPISFSATVESVPDISIPDLSGWSFTREVSEVDDAEIDGPINNMLDQGAELVPIKERALKESDYAIIDYSAKIDGKEVEKLSGKNAEMVVNTGDKNLLVDFFKELKGMNRGEEKEFSIKLSKQFPDPEIAGKKADFHVKVIDSKEKKLPELTDDYVIANTPYESIDDMKGKIRAGLEERTKHEGDAKLKAAILEKFVKETGFDLPPKMISEYADMHANRVRERAKWSGIQLENTPDFDKEKFEKTCLEQGERLAREEVIIGAVAEKENLRPEPKEIMKVQKEYVEIIKNQDPNAHGARALKAAEQRAFSLAVKEVTTETVFKHLYSKVKITDKTVTKAKEKK